MNVGKRTGPRRVLSTADRLPSWLYFISVSNVFFTLINRGKYTTSIDIRSDICWHKQVNRENWVSKTQPKTLDGFKLFYEELRTIRPAKQRLQRPRARANAN